MSVQHMAYESSGLISELLAEHDPAHEPRLIAGSHLPKLAAATQAAKCAITEFVGFEVPDAVYRYLYPENDEEINALKEFGARFNEAYPLGKRYDNRAAYPRILADNFTFDIRFNSDFYRYDKMVDSLAKSYRKLVTAEMLDHDTIRLELTPGLLHDVPNNFRNRTINSSTRDCALDTFNMHVMALAAPEVDLTSVENPSTLRANLEAQAPQRPQDLPWLLGSMATGSAAELLGHTVRVRTFVGADFAEIEQKYIQPVLARNNASKFFLSAITTSRNMATANHCVVVTDAKRDNVYTTDSIHRQRLIPSLQFLMEWFPTNMQSQLTIAIPHTT